LECDQKPENNAFVILFISLPMTTIPKKEPRNVQLNLNTVLLTICMGLSGWVLWSINQLDQEIAGLIPLINVNSSAIQDINKIDKDQTEKLSDALRRITVLETIQSIHSKK
jgi:hypothetical protein